MRKLQKISQRWEKEKIKPEQPEYQAIKITKKHNVGKKRKIQPEQPEYHCLRFFTIVYDDNPDVDKYFC